MNRAALWMGAASAAALGALALHRPRQARGEHARRAPALGHERPKLPGSRLATPPLPRTFDPIFEKYGRGLPLPYLRALAKRESGMNPHETNGPAWGLLQVVRVVLRDFNKRHGTAFARFDLLDARINVSVATDTLRRIISSYEGNHPDVPNLQARWGNPRFVEVLTFGWNAGWSERAGVGRVARFLEERGQHQKITIDTVYAHARAAGASQHLSNPRKVAWSKSVARLYQREKRAARAVAATRPTTQHPQL